MSKFLSFEGLDGCGKTTQMELLAAHLRGLGVEVVTTREPGGTGLGELLRGLVVRDQSGPAMALEAELGLMVVSRAQSVNEVILPALRRGAWVLCDRFHDATEAYQGGGRGLDRVRIRTLHRLLCQGLQPDRTVMLELDPEASLARARQRLAAGSGEGRFERQGAAFFAGVAQAYREIAEREPGRCRRVDASGKPEAVAERIRQALADTIPQAKH